MKHPKFFDEVEKISLKDDLAEFLGAFEKGVIEYSYLDIVKSAGHSCPTVAGAYLCAKEALKEFENPKRGEIEVYIKEEENRGTSGVIAAVFSQITGATNKSGFKGIAGQFDRRGLLHFSADIPKPLRLCHGDKKVDISYNPDGVPADEELKTLMSKVMTKDAKDSEKEAFRGAWQKRVEKILKNPSLVLEINVVQ